MDKILLETISALRNSNLSNYKIAQDTGISDQTISNYRAGKTTPRGNNLRTLHKYLCSNTIEEEPMNTSAHPPIEIEPVSGGEMNVSQFMNMMQQQMALVNNVVEQNRQLIDNNGKLVKVNETLAHTNKQLSHTNEKLMKELITLGKEERPAIDDFGSVEDRQ